RRYVRGEANGGGLWRTLWLWLWLWLWVRRVLLQSLLLRSVLGLGELLWLWRFWVRLPVRIRGWRRVSLRAWLALPIHAVSTIHAAGIYQEGSRGALRACAGAATVSGPHAGLRAAHLLAATA